MATYRRGSSAARKAIAVNGRSPRGSCAAAVSSSCGGGRSLTGSTFGATRVLAELAHVRLAHLGGIELEDLGHRLDEARDVDRGGEIAGHLVLDRVEVRDRDLGAL